MINERLLSDTVEFGQFIGEIFAIVSYAFFIGIDLHNWTTLSQQSMVMPSNRCMLVVLETISFENMENLQLICINYVLVENFYKLFEFNLIRD